MNIYLVQRGKIQKDFSKGKLSDVVRFDYMGSAEFEFGALPKSLRNLQSKKEGLILTEVKGRFDKSLFVLHTFQLDEEYKEYINLLDKLSDNKYSGGTKEISKFLKWEEHLKDQEKFNTVDFWWDIENDVMFSYDKNFMNVLSLRLEESWDFMNNQ